MGASSAAVVSAAGAPHVEVGMKLSVFDEILDKAFPARSGAGEGKQRSSRLH